MAISTRMSGWSGSSLAKAGQSAALAAFSVAVIRMVPEGFSRSSLKPASAPSMSSSAGPSVRSSRSPASVGARLRVVRVSSRSPRRSSSPRTG